MSTPATSTAHPDLLNERIVQLSFRKNMSRADLGAAIGIARPQVSRKINGRTPWSLSEVLRLAIVLETSVAYLVGETDDDAAPKTTAAPSAVDGADQGRLRESNSRPIHYE